MPHQLINTQHDIEDVCRHISLKEVIGVDTEFLRVKTYYPRLALVQISTPDRIYCIDPLAEEARFDSLWNLLADSNILKVMHAARQDVEVLLHTAGVMPRPLFDTQVAAGLLGYGEQVGYAGLVESEFEKTLPKTSQRTDWTRRPLTEAQVGYAENDVRFLLPLHELLKVRLEELGRLEWAREDFERVLDPGLYQPEPDEAYRRVGRGVHLKVRAQHSLKHLCAWRERTARNRDLPRHWVADDETLVSIAAASPQSVEELRRVQGLRRDLVRRDGEAVVACLNETLADTNEVWSRKEALTAEQKALKGKLIKTLKNRANELRIAESVLITRADLERLARGTSPREVVRGWRWRVVGKALEDTLFGAEQRVPARNG